MFHVMIGSVELVACFDRCRKVDGELGSSIYTPNQEGCRGMLSGPFVSQRVLVFFSGFLLAFFWLSSGFFLAFPFLATQTLLTIHNTRAQLL
jgi:hypothetical protein